jgi:hypothetical protein
MFLSLDWFLLFMIIGSIFKLYHDAGMILGWNHVITSIAPSNVRVFRILVRFYFILNGIHLFMQVS